MAKARKVADVKKFVDIPNVGKAVAVTFEQIGITHPSQLIGCDGFELYTKLCRTTGVRHDPCLLDTYLAVTDFMNGGVPKYWFKYTAARKIKYPSI